MGYGGVALLMAVESACIPLPSEIIMPFAGYLASTGRFDLFWVAVAGALGCNIGSTIAYAVGYWGGRPLVLRYGRFVLLDPAELDLVERFFARHGSATVFLARLLPVVRTYIALPAGIARMPMLRFQIFTFLGSLPWCWGLAYAGFRLGRAWDASPALQRTMHGLSFGVIALILAFAAWYGRRLWRNRARGTARVRPLP